MTFDELMNEIKELHILPNMAIRELPKALEDGTKRKLCRLGPEKAASVLKIVIEKVNKGSIEPLDVLVRDELKK